MHILIVKRDKIGDLLLTTPMLRLLRTALPAARIHVLANDYNHWVLAGNPDVDAVHVYRRVKNGRRLSPGAAWDQARVFLGLRATRFDWVLVGNGEESRRAIRRALWLKGRRTVAYCRAAADYPGLSDALPVDHPAHEARQLAGLLGPLGIAVPELLAALPEPRYLLPDPARAFARAWLAERGLAPGGYLTLGLGARRAKKQPTVEQITRWTRHAHETWGLATVFMWTPGGSDNPLYPGDDAVAQPVLDAGLPWLHPFRGPLQPALGLIWHGAASLFPDSGLMHFAAASPGGVVGLFAETAVSPPPWRWGPIGPRASYLEAPQAVAELSDAAVLDALGARVAAFAAATPG